MPTVYITAQPEGTVHEAEEVALLATTTTDQYDSLVARVGSIRPYEVSCIERFDEVAFLDAHADWREDAIDA